ncbi:MAG TPA: hypothetical protein PLJ88_07065, partial [Agitococcus sp.]|nr:hypothetical protein [Agitococcus sp.]
MSIEKPSPSDDLIPNFLKPYTPPTKNERAIESPEVEELAAFYAKELGRGSVNSFHINFAKAVLSKDVYSLEHLANGSNDVAKSVFTKATGVKLPKQQGQTWKALLEWAGVSQESDNLKKARSNVKYEYEKAKREYNLSDKTLEDFKESTLLKIADGYDKIINANKMYWLVNSLGQGYSLSEKGKKGVVGMSNLRNLIAALIEEYKASQLINAAKESALSINEPRPLLSSQDIKGLNKTLLLPENATKGDRKRAVAAWLKENLLGKQIKTSDDKVVRFNSHSAAHLKYNGNRDNLKAKAILYIADVFAEGQFVGREDLSHDRQDSFVAFHVYRKWCEVEGLNLHLEAHAGELENGDLELVAYNQKIYEKQKGRTRIIEDVKDTQSANLAPSTENNKPVFDDVQVSDDLAVEDGDLVRILEVKALVGKDERLTPTLEEFIKSTVVATFKSRYDVAYREFYVGIRANDSFMYLRDEVKEYRQKSYSQYNFHNLDAIKKRLKDVSLCVFAASKSERPTTEREAKEMAYDVLYRGKTYRNHFDDIGGFSFEPMVSVDATMQAIKKLMAENTLDNARYLAMIAGLKLKEDEPSQDLDMFGEPINQDFDLFGEPIQDGEESPVEELPRL